MNKRISSPKIYFVFSSIIFFFLVFVSCFKNDDPEIIINPPPVEPPPDTTTPPPPVVMDSVFILTGEYHNENGNPVFKIDSTQTSELLLGTKILARVSVDSPLEVDIVVTDLSLADSISNFEIKSVIAEENRSDTADWIFDTEFVLCPFQRLETINVVLVLDVSESLGNDFDDVKRFAKTFVQLVFLRAKNPKVGVVNFATEISPLSLISDSATANTFIDGATQGQFTALYDAMLRGVEILQADTADGEAIVTFTDGTNNFGTTSFQEILTALTNSGVQSFTIGFTGRGNLNQNVLRELALEDRNFIRASTLQELEDIFELIALLVSDAITFTYRRNSQVILSTDPIGIRFLITAERIEEE